MDKSSTINIVFFMSIRGFLLILFYIGFAFRINLIGQISYSELFLLGISPLILYKINWNDSEYRQLTFMYAVLLFVQIFSEWLIGNQLNNSLRGVFVTIVSFLHVMFLFQLLQKRTSLIPLLFLGQAVSMLVAGNPLVEPDEKFAVEEAATLKFYTGPIITFLLLFLTVKQSYLKKTTIFVLVGAVMIVLGARSQGAMMLLAPFGGIFSKIDMRKVSWRSFIKYSVPVFILLYCLYYFYVDIVLSGRISAGNNEQITMIENPYNPINLLMSGRTEFFVGMVALLDSFWIGHGAWAVDTTGKYTLLLHTIHNDSYIQSSNSFAEIPSHSVLLGYGVYNGIFALSIAAMILHFFIRRGLIALNRNSPFNIILSFSVIYAFWHAVFSPHTAFRLVLPVVFVPCWVLYRETKNRIAV